MVPAATPTVALATPSTPPPRWRSTLVKKVCGPRACAQWGGGARGAPGRGGGRPGGAAARLGLGAARVTCRTRTFRALLALICCGICTARLSAPRATSGKDLDATNFEKEVLRDDQVWLVEIGSKMCGSCQQFEPTWQEVKKRMKRINTGQVNIDEPNGMKAAQRLGARRPL